MLVAIISDVHNNETNLKKVLDYCQQEKIQTIICCGDLASEETLDFLNDTFPGKIHYTFGNMDEGQLKENIGAKTYKHTKIYNPYGELEIDGQKIAFVHYPEVARKLSQTGKYDYVFHGHTHKPWTQKIGDCVILNPGNVAGEIYLPTFAIWNTEKGSFNLIKIHDLR